jgi:hypothetical protein
MRVVCHVLDGATGGETGWLQRLNGFQQKEIRRQAHFKWHHWPELGDGEDRDRPAETFPHILPAGHERDVFYPGHADTILAYAESEGLHLRDRVLNLLESQAACINVLFHFRQNPDWAALALGPLLPGVVRLEGLHFEYTGPAATTDWLGEPADGGCGQNRTSIDVALEWLDRDGRRCLTLVEWKYTEASFGECGGFKSEANQQRERCKNLAVADVDPDVDCYLESRIGPTTTRNYWERLAGSGIDLGPLAATRGCPFRGPLYQLMRQTLLAGYLRAERIADWVDLAVVSFEHNNSLLAVPRELKSWQPDGGVVTPANVLDVWNSALIGAPTLRYVSAERLTMEVDRVGGADPEWRRYLRERYGL